MKLKDWKKLGKVRYHGHDANVYEPFIKALNKPHLTDRERREIVEDILKSNGNHPNIRNIDHYLNVHMLYLKQKNKNQ